MENLDAVLDAADTETLLRWGDTFNFWKWPDDFPIERPDWWDRETQMWPMYTYTRPVMEGINDRTTLKERLWYHWEHNLNRTRVDFEVWWYQEHVLMPVEYQFGV